MIKQSEFRQWQSLGESDDVASCNVLTAKCLEFHAQRFKDLHYGVSRTVAHPIPDEARTFSEAELEALRRFDTDQADAVRVLQFRGLADTTGLNVFGIALLQSLNSPSPLPG